MNSQDHEHHGDPIASWRPRFRLSALFWIVLLVAAFFAGRESRRWDGTMATRITWPVELRMQPGQRATISLPADSVSVVEELQNGAVTSSVVVGGDSNSVEVEALGPGAVEINALNPGNAVIRFRTYDGTRGYLRVSVASPAGDAER